MSIVIVSGSFDDLRSCHLRFLELASAEGHLHVFLWDDGTVRAMTGREPKFGLDERRYFVESLRWVEAVQTVSQSDLLTGKFIATPAAGGGPEPILLVAPIPGLLDGDMSGKGYLAASEGTASFCEKAGFGYRVLGSEEIAGFPLLHARASERTSERASDVSVSDTARSAKPARHARTRVMVTGSFDWLHTGHVRFFEEAAGRGDLTVVVGHDANILLLKGEGHPLLPENERLYMVASIRHVSNALISTGSGWLDAQPEMERLNPDEYIVNADGDKPEKRRYCESHGIRYVVLERKPREGLPLRSSTELRGF